MHRRFLRALIISLLAPMGMALLICIIVAIVLCAVRIDFPGLYLITLGKLAKPIVAAFIPLSLLFLFSVWLTTRKIFLSLKKGEISEKTVEALIKTPAQIAMISFITWILASPLVFVLCYSAGINLSTSIAVAIIPLCSSMCVPTIYYFGLNHHICSMLEGSRLKLTGLVLPMKYKLILPSLMFSGACLILLIFISVETSIRSARDVLGMMPAERLGIPFEITDTISPLEPAIVKSIKYKLRNGERSLLDPFSLGVFVFMEEGGSIVGSFLPFDVGGVWIPKFLIISFTIAVILGVAFFILSSFITSEIDRSLGETLKQAKLLSMGRETKVVPTDDELSDLTFAMAKASERETQLRRSILEHTEKMESLAENSSNLSSSISEILDNISFEHQELEIALRSLRDTLLSASLELGIPPSIEISELEEIGKLAESISKDIDKFHEDIKALFDRLEKLVERIAELREVRLSLELSEIDSNLKKLKREVDGAREGLKNLMSSINSLAEPINEVSGKLPNLIDYTDKMERILRGIRDISRRATLLSLNASIIAVQTGEGGKEFQVVADSISKIGDGTESFRREIENVLRNMKPEVEHFAKSIPSLDEVKKSVSELDNALELITETITLLSELIERDKISLTELSENLMSSNEYITSAKEIAEGMENLDALKRRAEEVRMLVSSLSGKSISAVDAINKSYTKIVVFIEELMRKTEGISSTVKGALEQISEIIGKLSEIGRRIETLRSLAQTVHKKIVEMDEPLKALRRFKT